MFNIYILATIVTVTTFLGTVVRAAEPVDYFRTALTQNGFNVTDVRVLKSEGPLVVSSRGTVYLDKVAQALGAKSAAFRFYRFAFVVDGKIQDCIGRIGDQPKTNEKVVDIEQCNVGFFDGDASTPGFVLVQTTVTLE